MARRSWTKTEAREVQKRLFDVVEKIYGGVQAEFVRTCKLSRDTAAKWFGQDFRVPDTLTLKRIADRSGVSLDWLVLGRGEMLWPPGNALDAPDQLYNAIHDRLLRSADGYDVAVLQVVERWGPKTLWNIVVKRAEELEALSSEATEVYAGRESEFQDLQGLLARRKKSGKRRASSY